MATSTFVCQSMLGAVSSRSASRAAFREASAAARWRQGAVARHGAREPAIEFTDGNRRRQTGSASLLAASVGKRVCIVRIGRLASGFEQAIAASTRTHARCRDRLPPVAGAAPSTCGPRLAGRRARHAGGQRRIVARLDNAVRDGWSGRRSAPRWSRRRAADRLRLGADFHAARAATSARPEAEVPGAARRAASLSARHSRAARPGRLGSGR